MPDLVLRFGDMPTSKPLRAWLAATGADQIVVDPSGGWNEPTRRAAAMLRADPTELAAGWAARVERGDPAGAARWIEAERPPRGRSPPSWGRRRAHRAGACTGRSGRPTATATSSTPLRACRSATRRPSCRRRDRRRSSSATAAPTASTASSPRASAPPHASGRPTTIVTGDLGLLHDIGGLAALRDVETPVRIVVIDNDGGGIFHFLPQAEALDEDEFEALLGTPRGVDTEKAAALFGLPYRGSSPRRAPRGPRRGHRPDRGRAPTARPTSRRTAGSPRGGARRRSADRQSAGDRAGGAAWAGLPRRAVESDSGVGGEHVHRTAAVGVHLHDRVTEAAQAGFTVVGRNLRDGEPLA